MRDELDERVTAIRALGNEKKRKEIAAQQIDFFTRRMIQVSWVPYCPGSLARCRFHL